MLTTLESNFVQEYKNTGSATKALRSIGCKLPPESLKVKAYRMIRKPEIKRAIDNYTVNLDNELTKPVITKVNPVITYDDTKVRVISLPTKEEYAQKAWERSSDESKLKDDLKHKYYETAGKVLRYIGNDTESNERGNILNILCNDLKLSIGANENIFSELAAERQRIENSNTNMDIDISSASNKPSDTGTPERGDT